MKRVFETENLQVHTLTVDYDRPWLSVAKRPVDVYVGFIKEDVYPVVVVHASVEKREDFWFLECIETTKASEEHLLWNIPLFDTDWRIELGEALDHYLDGPLIFEPRDDVGEDLLAKWRPGHYEVYLEDRKAGDAAIREFLETHPIPSPEPKRRRRKRRKRARAERKD